MARKRANKKQKENQKQKWMTLTDANPIKKTFLSEIREPSKLFMVKTLNNFRKAYNNNKGNLEDHVRYGADPILELLYPMYEKIIPMFHEKHPRNAIRDGGAFLLYFTSSDSAYRPARNLLLDWLTQPETVEKIRAALKQEKEIEDYTNEDLWYDNLKVAAVRHERKLKEDGVISEDETTEEKAMFIDEWNFHKFEQHVKKQK